MDFKKGVRPQALSKVHMCTVADSTHGVWLVLGISKLV